MLTNATPAKKSIKSKACALSTGVIVKSKYPIMIFNKAQSTFNFGEESPLLIGMAKGVGNLSNEMPCTKSGIALVKINPEKYAVELYRHSIGL